MLLISSFNRLATIYQKIATICITRKIMYQTFGADSKITFSDTDTPTYTAY